MARGVVVRADSKWWRREREEASFCSCCWAAPACVTLESTLTTCFRQLRERARTGEVVGATLCQSNACCNNAVAGGMTKAAEDSMRSENDATVQSELGPNG